MRLCLGYPLLCVYNYILAERGNEMKKNENNAHVFKFGSLLYPKTKVTLEYDHLKIEQNKRKQIIKFIDIAKVYHQKGDATDSTTGKICFSEKDGLSLRDILLLDQAFTYPPKQLPQAEKFLELLEGIPLEEVQGLGEEAVKFHEEQQKQALDLAAPPQGTDNLGLAEFDETNRVARFFTGYAAGGWEEVPFELIRGYEVEEDGETKVASGAKAAAIGTVLFGPAGMVAGAIIGNGKEKEFANSLNLAVMLKGRTTIRITFLSKPTKKNSSNYQQAVDSLELIANYLSPIISENASKEEVSEAIEKNRSDNRHLSSSSIGDIREFKVLLDEGIITQKEFDQKKRELLGL